MWFLRVRMELGNRKIRGEPHADGIGLPKIWYAISQKCSFIARQPTGEVYSSELAAQFPERDWILSRILWLDGLEEGFNKGEGHDTMQRYIYIHGTPDKEPMGVPMSHGCIRMRNEEIIELFDLVSEDALVYLSEQSLT